jgi:hypothetical protein
MTTRAGRITAALALAITGACVGACGGPVSTAARPCPCAAGYVCCESGVCAAEEGACGAATGALSAEAQGRWMGYIENPPGYFVSDALDLTFDVDADGSLRGRVVFGNGAQPGAPTEARMFWPPVEKGGALFDETHLFAGLFRPVEGVPLTARGVKWQARRLRFIVNVREAFDPWCALQTPYPYSVGAYACAPESGGAYQDDNGKHVCLLGAAPNLEVVDCRWRELCGLDRACACTASECTGNAAAESADLVGADVVLRFDIALSGDEAEGSMGDYNIRLVRASR